MNEWITDREPEQADADDYGYILITTPCGRVVPEHYRKVINKSPWKRLPNPYRKPEIVLNDRFHVAPYQGKIYTHSDICIDDTGNIVVEIRSVVLSEELKTTQATSCIIDSKDDKVIIVCDREDRLHCACNTLNRAKNVEIKRIKT